MKFAPMSLSIFSMISGSVIYMSGEYDHWLALALGELLLIDLVSFLLSSKITDNLNWSIFLKETFKRGMILGIVAISYILDMILLTGDIIKNSTLVFYISYELATILSYAIKVGLPMPAIIEKTVYSIKKEKSTEKAE